MLPMKAWLTTGAFALAIVQVLTALSMRGRVGSRAPTWIAPLHRWSGTAAFVLTLPVAFHCVWSLGFATDSTWTLVHSIAGCAFYGVFAAKMLSLRLPGLVLDAAGARRPARGDRHRDPAYTEDDAASSGQGTVLAAVDDIPDGGGVIVQDANVVVMTAARSKLSPQCVRTRAARAHRCRTVVSRAPATAASSTSVRGRCCRDPRNVRWLR